MKRFVSILLFLCSIPFQMSAFPFGAYSSELGQRVDLPQWVVQGTGGNAHMYVNSALGIPALGVYDGAGYRFRISDTIIINTPRLLEVAPQEVRDAVVGRDTNIYTIFWPPQLDPASDGHENIALHPVVRMWQPPTYAEASNFNPTVQAGIFGMTTNVRTNIASAISAGQLGGLSVNYHDHVYFSPDNGRIVLPSNQNEVATFWLVALSPYDNRAIVVFNIVGPSQLQELSAQMGRERSIASILNEMYNLPVTNPAVLHDAIDTLRHDFNLGAGVAPQDQPGIPGMCEGAGVGDEGSGEELHDQILERIRRAAVSELDDISREIQREEGRLGETNVASLVQAVVNRGAQIEEEFIRATIPQQLEGTTEEEGTEDEVDLVKRIPGYEGVLDISQTEIFTQEQFAKLIGDPEYPQPLGIVRVVLNQDASQPVTRFYERSRLAEWLTGSRTGDLSSRENWLYVGYYGDLRGDPLSRAQIYPENISYFYIGDPAGHLWSDERLAQTEADLLQNLRGDNFEAAEYHYRALERALSQDDAQRPFLDDLRNLINERRQEVEGPSIEETGQTRPPLITEEMQREEDDRNITQIRSLINQGSFDEARPLVEQLHDQSMKDRLERLIERRLGEIELRRRREAEVAREMEERIERERQERERRIAQENEARVNRINGLIRANNFEGARRIAGEITNADLRRDVERRIRALERDQRAEEERIERERQEQEQERLAQAERERQERDQRAEEERIERERQEQEQERLAQAERERQERDQRAEEERIERERQDRERRRIAQENEARVNRVNRLIRANNFADARSILPQITDTTMRGDAERRISSAQRAYEQAQREERERLEREVPVIEEEVMSLLDERRRLESEMDDFARRDPFIYAKTKNRPNTFVGTKLRRIEEIDARLRREGVLRLESERFEEAERREVQEAPLERERSERERQEAERVQREAEEVARIERERQEQAERLEREAPLIEGEVVSLLDERRQLENEMDDFERRNPLIYAKTRNRPNTFVGRKLRRIAEIEARLRDLGR